MSVSRFLPLGVLLFIFSLSSLWGAGEVLKHDPAVPSGLAFVRSIDVDAFVQRANRHGLGNQTGRIRLRYLDPDVNAFVGMLVGVHHFNQDLRIGDSSDPATAGVMVDWGGDFGIVRGNHLWELDLMGSSLSQRLGFAPAIVGEHRLPHHWMFWHRTELTIFMGDAMLDADQGFTWMWTPSFGLSAGYRWLTSRHMDRSGPHLGIRLYFENPKIPFIFPSLG